MRREVSDLLLQVSSSHAGVYLLDKSTRAQDRQQAAEATSPAHCCGSLHALDDRCVNDDPMMICLSK